jgi:hypothetical protein
MTMTSLFNIVENVCTHAYPKSSLIPEPMRQDRKHHALMTMPTAVGLTQNNKKKHNVTELTICYSSVCIYVNCNCYVSVATAGILMKLYHSVETRNMTDRTVFGRRKFCALYLQRQFACYEMYITLG